MKVKYRHEEGQFPFKEGDDITVVVHYLYVKDTEDELYYHGKLTKIEEEGFWCVLEDDETKEEYFSFLDVENVIWGDRIPFLGGTTKRADKIISIEDEAMEHIREIAVLKGISEKEAIATVVNLYASKHARMIKDAHKAAERARQRYDK